MIGVIARDIVPYIIVYLVIIVALMCFCIVNMPHNEGFADADTITSGVLSSLLIAWQTGVMSEFDVDDYGTAVAKLVFVLFSAFGILGMCVADHFNS